MKITNALLFLIIIFIINIGTLLAQGLDIDDQLCGDNPVKFTISIDNAPKTIDSLQFDIIFDVNILEYTNSFTKGNLTEGFNFFDVKEVSSGQIRIAGVTNTDIESGTSGEIATLEFNVINEQNTIITFDNIEGDISEWTTGDGLLTCVDVINNPPQFDNECGTRNVEIDIPITFNLQVSDSDAEDTVKLFAEGLPVGAVMAPQLPVKGNPIQSQFSWTPTEEQIGTHDIEFIAVDDKDKPSQTSCKVTILVGTPPPPTQLIAEFDAGPITGFKPLTVDFTDKSKGDPSSWSWDFGDGATSTEQNPTHTYDESGDFTVKLTVSNSEGSDTDEEVIVVKDVVGLCKAAFNVDKTAGFSPLEVKFIDISNGNPTSWAWDFGDGAASSLQNPTHTYQVPGIFTVKLTISADCGADVITQTNLILVESQPSVNSNFSANLTAGFVPLTVQFTDLTTGNPSSWAWEFGDGGTSIDQNPLHTYTFPGLFTINLTTSNANGAGFEQKTNLINVLPLPAPTAEFQGSPLAGFTPLKVIFTDTSTGNISNWNWDFGDSSISTLQNPVHEYKNPGFFNVKLTVSGVGGAGFEEKINLINLLDGQAPTAEFLGEPLAGRAPFTVHFFDQSSGEIANRNWDFGDGEFSTEQNPAHTFNSPGNFNVKLIVSGKDGTSEESKINYVTVISGNAPTAAFTADKKSGITSGSNQLTVRFTDISSSPTNSKNKWDWNFGDGTRSSEQNPEHTFTGSEDGAFTVSLTVRDSRGRDTVTRPAFISLTESNLAPNPTPNETTTPTPSVAVPLTVNPKTAGKSFNFKTAIVSVIDQNGLPVPGVNIAASEEGRFVFVRPSFATTGSDGDASFDFRFGLLGSNGKVVFTANGMVATIMSE